MDVRSLSPQASGDAQHHAPAPSRRKRPHRHPWEWVIAVVVLTAASLGVGALAWTNAGRAADWQETAEALREERDETAAELQDLSEALEKESARLANVRRKARSLEGRVRTLANEKATVEDEREVAEGVAQFMTSLAAEASDVGEQLDECINQTSSWLARTPSYYDSEWVWDSWGTEASAVSSYCNDAQGAFYSLETRLAP